MKTVVEQHFEKHYNRVHQFYRVLVSEPRMNSAGTKTYDHIIWVGEAPPENFESLKRKARKVGASFRGVKPVEKHYDYFQERD